MVLDGKFKALAEDHNSLLSAALRTLESLEELKALALRTASNGHNTAGADSGRGHPSSDFPEKDALVGELNHLFERRDAASLEVFAAVEKLMSSLESRFLPSLESMRGELAYNSRLVAEHVPIHVESSSFGALNPEAGLMDHLYSFMPVPTALDVGANRGDVSRELLDAGYQVYAFEPHPVVFEELRGRLNSNKNCVLYDFAVGPADGRMDLHFAEDTSAEGKYGDTSLYSTLAPHAMPDDLQFVKSVNVPVRSLASLAREGRIPEQVGLLKIDTEGFDLEVMRGMGELRPLVVAAEFWASDFVFGHSHTSNRLDELVEEMRKRQYRWYIVMYRRSGSERVSFYCNYKRPVSNSWGNVFFFQQHELFVRGVEWCAAVLPRTYLNVDEARAGLRVAHSEAIQPALNARIAKLEKLLELNEAETQKLGKKFGELVVLQRREIASYDEKIARLTKQAKDAHERLRRAQARFDKMRRSFSWKVTSPFRELWRAAGRVAHLFD
jgi:FkbM family methyltransferase